MVESVLTTMVFVTLAVGTIDLGMGVLRNHLVCEASRQAARIASVQGSRAPAALNGGPWGTTAYSGNGNATDAIVTKIRSSGALAGLNLADTTISISWPDGSNDASPPSYTGVAAGTYRVQATVSSTWTPVMGFIFGNSSYTLSATSVMPIAH